MLADAAASNRALEDLLDLVCTTPFLRPVLDDFDLSRDQLRTIYRELITGGAAVWVRGHWVAASALCFTETLSYVARARGEGVALVSDAAIVPTVIEYFAKGRIALPAPIHDAPD
jgi:hypothetical protein